MVSEEDEDPIICNPQGKYGIAFDPLDGCVCVFVPPRD
jgi:fructose-1,6-bisphosphatase